MRRLATVAFLLLGVVTAAQEPFPELVEGPVFQAHQPSDTLRASVVSSTAGSLIVPQRVSSEQLKTVTGLSEAVRRFTGVQIRDYGGVGGLKTVNVRSLGSEYTGVFVDGIQIDNAQNMQVDLGRLNLDGLASVSLFSGQKVSPLQSAKEYSSASALYLESAEPYFLGGRKDNFHVGTGAGSFLTVAPKLSWEHLFKSGASLRLSTDAMSSKGEYRFHVKDFRQYPGGTIAGYDTTMLRKNCDLSSVRAEAMLFSPRSNESSWNVKAYFYGSGRGLPGPVYKKAGGYPLSLDRQTDRDAFVQGRYYRSLGDVWSFAARAKLSFNHLEYIDFPEDIPRLVSSVEPRLVSLSNHSASPAHYNYRNHSAYLSASAMAVVNSWFKVNLAQDLQYDYLDADLRGFVYPVRLTSWSSLSARFAPRLASGAEPFDVSATILYLDVSDTFLSFDHRSKARRNVWMPSLVARWKIADGLTVNGFAKRSYRMPTFNDLYYTTVGTKTLDPEDAIQFDLGAEWIAVRSRDRRLSFKADIYRNLLKNKIIAVPTSNQFRWSMYNIGRVDVLGSDVTADYSFKAGRGEFGAVARYTFQQARDRSEWNGQIPYIPLHSGSVNLSGSLSGWRTDVTLFATGERFTTSANLPAYRLAPWTTLDAAVSKKIAFSGNELTLKLCLNNLLDQQYEIVDNYPMPGFNFLLSAVVFWR